jgi:two-component system phosphate regulon response regulator PhoB
VDRILVVEDEEDINTVLQEGMRLAGYEAIGALTGSDALREIDRRLPDLVLLDQMLPDIDGLELCRQLREAPRTKRLPIIFLTARAGEEARVRGLAIGADDYVVKPFSMKELTLRVGAVLRRSAPSPAPSLSSDWIRCREQFRIWDTYARLHLDRGEWRECQELCRNILGRCEEALSHAERFLLYTRLARCAERLGDSAAEQTWQERAHEQARFV